MRHILAGKNIVLGVTGGIAAYKAVSLLRLLRKSGAEVQVVGTANSLNLVGKATWEALSGRQPLFDTWECPDSSKVTHIMLAQEVDMIVVAPATANILGKAANGIADDLLSTVLLAATVPVLFAPAMNVEMYNNPATQRNMGTLGERTGINFVEPGTGELACNTSGKGRMAEPEEVFRAAAHLLTPKGERKFRWLVGAGCTREYIDPVRYITNGSTGRTGLAIAESASAMGGDVTLVAGNMNLPHSTGITVEPVVSAEDMYETITRRSGDVDILVMSAAVADYSPQRSDRKVKKGEGTWNLELLRTKDVLYESGHTAPSHQVRIGFAAETENVVENARRKLEKKNLDMVVANRVSEGFNPFGSERNRVVLVFAERVEELEEMDKDRLGAVIAERAYEMALEKCPERSEDD